MSLIQTYESLFWLYPSGEELQSAITAVETGFFTLTTNGIYFFLTGRGYGYTPCGKTTMERVCL